MYKIPVAIGSLFLLGVTGCAPKFFAEVAEEVVEEVIEDAVDEQVDESLERKLKNK